MSIVSFEEKYRARKAIEDFNVDEVIKLLHREGLQNCSKAIQMYQIDGLALFGIKESLVKFWKRDIEQSDAERLLQFIDKLKENPELYYIKHDANDVSKDSYQESFENDDSDDSFDEVVYENGVVSKFYPNHAEQRYNNTQTNVQIDDNASWSSKNISNTVKIHHNDSEEINSLFSPKLSESDKEPGLPPRDTPKTSIPLPKIIPHIPGRGTPNKKTASDNDQVDLNEKHMIELLEKLNFNLSEEHARELLAGIRNLERKERPKEKVTQGNSQMSAATHKSKFSEIHKKLQESFGHHQNSAENIVEKSEVSSESNRHHPNTPSNEDKFDKTENDQIGGLVNEARQNPHYDVPRSHRINTNERNENENALKFKTGLEHVLENRVQHGRAGPIPVEEEPYVEPITGAQASNRRFRELPPVPEPLPLDHPITPVSRKPSIARTSSLRKNSREDKFEEKIEHDPHFRNISAREASDILKNKRDGSFLIRPSQNQGYTLMLRFQGQDFNLKIRMRPDGKLALGAARDGESAFTKLSSLIKFYSPGVEELELSSPSMVYGKTYLYPI